MEAKEGQSSETSEPVGTVTKKEVCCEGVPTRYRGTRMSWPNEVAPLGGQKASSNQKIVPSNLKMQGVYTLQRDEEYPHWPGLAEL